MPSLDDNEVVFPSRNKELGIYSITRALKREQQGLHSCIHSVAHDAKFVSEIRGLYPDLPLLANLRCGLWYAPRPDATCYFKSTDGHSGGWSFSTTRLNWHVAQTAARRGGVLIVDATRKGKRFPDALTKTVPIWAAVINRAVARVRAAAAAVGAAAVAAEPPDSDAALPAPPRRRGPPPRVASLGGWLSDEAAPASAHFSGPPPLLASPCRVAPRDSSSDAADLGVTPLQGSAAAAPPGASVGLMPMGASSGSTIASGPEVAAVAQLAAEDRQSGVAPALPSGLAAFPFAVLSHPAACDASLADGAEQDRAQPSVAASRASFDEWDTSTHPAANGRRPAAAAAAAAAAGAAAAAAASSAALDVSAVAQDPFAFQLPDCAKSSDRPMVECAQLDAPPFAALHGDGSVGDAAQAGSPSAAEAVDGTEAPHASAAAAEWDIALHLPPWISGNERLQIELRLDSWVDALLAVGADVQSLSEVLLKPLRPLWVSPASRIWTDQVAQPDELTFTPLVLITASQPKSYQRQVCTPGGVAQGVGALEGGAGAGGDAGGGGGRARPVGLAAQDCTYIYLPGAGDDEESWSTGLTPELFWAHSQGLLQCSPDALPAAVCRLLQQELAHAGCPFSQDGLPGACAPALPPMPRSSSGSSNSHPSPLGWLRSSAAAIEDGSNDVAQSQPFSTLQQQQQQHHQHQHHPGPLSSSEAATSATLPMPPPLPSPASGEPAASGMGSLWQRRHGQPTPSSSAAATPSAAAASPPADPGASMGSLWQRRHNAGSATPSATSASPGSSDMADTVPLSPAPPAPPPAAADAVSSGMGSLWQRRHCASTATPGAPGSGDSGSPRSSPPSSPSSPLSAPSSGAASGMGSLWQRRHGATSPAPGGTHTTTNAPAALPLSPPLQPPQAADTGSANSHMGSLWQRRHEASSSAGAGSSPTTALPSSPPAVSGTPSCGMGSLWQRRHEASSPASLRPASDSAGSISPVSRSSGDAAQRRDGLLGLPGASPGPAVGQDERLPSAAAALLLPPPPLGLHNQRPQGCTAGGPLRVTRRGAGVYLVGDSGIALGGWEAGAAHDVWQHVDAVLNCAPRQQPGMAAPATASSAAGVPAAAAAASSTLGAALGPSWVQADAGPQVAGARPSGASQGPQPTCADVDFGFAVVPAPASASGVPSPLAALLVAGPGSRVSSSPADLAAAGVLVPQHSSGSSSSSPSSSTCSSSDGSETEVRHRRRRRGGVSGRGKGGCGDAGAFSIAETLDLVHSGSASSCVSIGSDVPLLTPAAAQLPPGSNSSEAPPLPEQQRARGMPAPQLAPAPPSRFAPPGGNSWAAFLPAAHAAPPLFDMCFGRETAVGLAEDARQSPLAAAVTDSQGAPPALPATAPGTDGSVLPVTLSIPLGALLSNGLSTSAQESACHGSAPGACQRRQHGDGHSCPDSGAAAASGALADTAGMRAGADSASADCAGFAFDLPAGGPAPVSSGSSGSSGSSQQPPSAESYGGDQAVSCSASSSSSGRTITAQLLAPLEPPADHCAFSFSPSSSTPPRASVSSLEPEPASAAALVGDAGAAGVPPAAVLPTYQWLPVKSSKLQRSSLLDSLGEALEFASHQLACGRTVLIHDAQGLDHCVCIAVSLLLACFDAGDPANGVSPRFVRPYVRPCSPDPSGIARPSPAADDAAALPSPSAAVPPLTPTLATSIDPVTKHSVRQRLAWLSSCYPQARPTRGSLKQVYNFFNAPHIPPAGGESCCFRPDNGGGRGDGSNDEDAC